MHVGMSNTRNTPIEVLELEIPVRVRRYARRWGSGGRGKWVGGDGVVRELEAIEPMMASLLTERRRHAPRGASGGGDGAPGRNRHNDRDVAAKAQVSLERGDILRIETPGGGGWGLAGNERAREQ
jgi:N-methylhydantoinase B